jgi:hypothetical protein
MTSHQATTSSGEIPAHWHGAWPATVSPHVVGRLGVGQMSVMSESGNCANQVTMRDS